MEFYLSISKASLFLGVSVSTLRRWHQSLFFIPELITCGSHRRYSMQQCRQFKNKENNVVEKIVVCYARVSTHDQKKVLETQAELLLNWCEQQQIKQVKVIKELGSGLNYQKKGLKQLIGLILSGVVGTLVLTHKDRLLRFGADLILYLCQLQQIKVIFIQEIGIVKSVTEQLTEDVMALMTVFTAKLHGMRSHKNKNKLNQ